MKTANKTDIGRIRLVNEDSALVTTGPNGYTIGIVADGMGGHQAGDIASRTAIETIQAHLQAIPPNTPKEECATLIRESVYVANSKIYGLAAEHEELRGMGTTIVVVIATDEWFVLGHVGDSRAYLAAKGSKQARCLTEDHSLVNELVKSGQITKSEAEHHPRRNVLTRALGTDPYVEVDTAELRWEEGDLLMVCSDGLSNMVSDREIQSVMTSARDLNWMANKLVQKALEAGGDDNITVVLMANEKEEQGGEAAWSKDR